ncbi:hypothetical protein HELRODRAFT_176522 [Helobdella robusta]|uniref:Methyltransferase type 11 domain-containing protein n=1 Tax=Helobdella robusta TaxID=6412 RepID=T1FAL9_HELRO|nr:hypothetical protein HELRODRAFT_176522 [Helobdella robusta]ESN99760.1 hypothetical protein HELRODRAFT_176522 [Helobdella robusta]
MAFQETYPDMLKLYRRRHNELEVLQKLMDRLSNEYPVLDRATTCLSVGTGYGEYDIEFIRRCLPNLKTLIAVEVNHDCVLELKANLHSNFGDKLNSEIHEMSIGEYMQLYDDHNDERTNEPSSTKNNLNLKNLPNKEIDVVLALHVIYFLNKQSRAQFYKKCFGQWLRSEDGLLILANVTDNHSMVKLANSFKPYSSLTSTTIKDELIENNVSIVREFNYRCPVDMSVDTVDLHRLFKYSFKDSNLSEERIGEAVKIIAPDGRAFHDCDLCVCIKLN